jgi:hypothetical protein
MLGTAAAPSCHVDHVRLRDTTRGFDLIAAFGYLQIALRVIPFASEFRLY